jgi:hypothetical protein
MPDDEKLLKCSCKECGNHLAFGPSMLNTVITCPHCGQWTELSSDSQAGLGEPKSRRFPVMVLVGVLVLAAAAAGGFVFMKNKKSDAETKPLKMALAPINAAPEPAPPPATTETVAENNVQRTKSLDDLKVSVIELQKTPGTSLVHAVGTVKNDSDFVRFGVKIELALFNKDGKKIGTAQDYQSTIEPHKDWRFKALVADPRTVTTKFTSLTEDE